MPFLNRLVRKVVTHRAEIHNLNDEQIDHITKEVRQFSKHLFAELDRRMRLTRRDSANIIDLTKILIREGIDPAEIALFIRSNKTPFRIEQRGVLMQPIVQWTRLPSFPLDEQPDLPETLAPLPPLYAYAKLKKMEKSSSPVDEEAKSTIGTSDPCKLSRLAVLNPSIDNRFANNPLGAYYSSLSRYCEKNEG
ncbi:hypothetical protein ACOME3_002039 [Neoechinorhynchus agilis]